MKDVTSNIITGTVFVAAAVAAIYGGSRPAYSEQDLECMAMNIYHEARGEAVLGQIAVAQVVMNRLDHEYFPNDVCEVVWQPHQFSWTSDGRSDVAHDQERYEIAENIAITVLEREEDDPTGGALFYHADYISAPSWTRQMDVSLEYGVHMFYTWDGTWD